MNQVEIDTYPEKIYVEITTRCNLQCRMCVKYAAGSTIIDEDLPLAVFKNLTPALSRAKTLILNGIGEPLLHPDLTEIIRLARASMPPGATIGFQTNGFLLDEQKSFELVAAGLNTVCLSLDSLEESPFPERRAFGCRRFKSPQASFRGKRSPCHRLAARPGNGPDQG